MGHELSDGVGEFGRFENLDRGDECLDEALTALLGRHRSAEIDAAYAAAYEAHPIDGEDDWGDPASFRRAASAT